jgi:hypothetical protein
MKPTLRIEIPEPCNVPWNSMLEVANGKRHCGSCDKVLTDFTQWSDEQLIHYFTQNKGKLCGRFSGEQLNRNITAPEVKQRFWPRLLVPAFLISVPALIPVNLSAQLTTEQKETSAQKKTEPEKKKITISGTIFENDTTTCIGALIRIVNGNDSVMAISDFDGRFSVVILANENDTLHSEIKCYGYEPYNQDLIVVKDQNKIEFSPKLKVSENQDQIVGIIIKQGISLIEIKEEKEVVEVSKPRRFFRRLFHPFSH